MKQRKHNYNIMWLLETKSPIMFFRKAHFGLFFR